MPAPNTPVPSLDFTSDPWGEAMTALNALLKVIAAQPQNRIPLIHDCRQDGLLTLIEPNVLLRTSTDPDDPESPINSVGRISLTSITDGMSVFLEAERADNPVNIRHLDSGGALSGEIDLAGDTDMVLAAKGERLWLQRRGLRIVEVARFGFAAAGGGGVEQGPLVQFNNDIDAQGNTISNYSRKWRESQGAVTSITTADRGTTVHVYGGTVALPTDPTGWTRNDELMLVQETGEMLITPAVNLVTPLNHDRGYGFKARVLCIVDRPINPMKWYIGGMTRAPSGGTTTPPPSGGGGTPPATEINRTFVFSNVATTFVTPASSIVYEPAHTLQHTPGDNERWFYVGLGLHTSSAAAFSNRTLVRLKAATDAEGPVSTAGQYPQHRESAGVVAYRAWGPAPGPKTMTLEVKPGDALYTSSIIQPGIFGLRLEPDEHGTNMFAAVVTVAPHTTPVDALVYVGNFLADDYVVLAAAEWTNDTTNDGSTVSLVVDTNIYGVRPRAKAFNVNMTGSWAMIKPVTFAAGSHTIKVRIASAGVGTHSSRITRAQIVVLKKSRFQSWAFDEELAEVSTTLQTPTVRGTVTTTLLDGWDYLVMGSGALRLSNENANSSTRMQMFQGAAAITPEIRSGPRIADSYHPTNGLMATVVRGAGTSQTFSIRFYSQGAADTASIADAAIVVLPLKRV